MRKKLAVLLGTGMGLCLAATLSAQTVNLPAGADSYIRSGNADHNWGPEDHLRVRGSERYRSLVRFDQAALAAAVGQGSLVSATLELSVDDVSGNWGGSGQTVDLHRLTAAWTEGGVTWNCAVDSSPGNNRTDCSSNWAGGAFEPAATDTLFVTRDLNGRVSLDVTADVASFLSGTPNFGWLLKKTDESGSSQIDFKSRERGPNSAPRLVLVVESATSDAVPPRLAITQPERSFVVNDPTPAIELSYSDGGSGVNLASLQVTVDGGAASCQAGPSSALCEPAPLGSGQHTISVSLADVAGNRATATARFQLVIGPALHTLTFPALGDTYIDQGKADRNFGGENELKLGKSPRRRSLAQFDGATLGSLAAGGTLVSAKLLVTVKENHGNWGRSGREVGAHRLNTAWTERGATWNCAVDSNPGNDRTDCNPGWNGGDFEAAASSTVTVTGRTRGTLELDVTADVAAVLAGGPHRGWLIKKEDEGSSGEMEFFSRERSRQHPPTLVVVINVPALDTTPPTIVASVAPAPNGAGWNRSAVTVSFTCTDSGSGVALCPDPVTLTTDGAAQVVSGTATDVAGNSASTSVTVNLDATAPAVLASADPAPNGAGWNRTAVTISFQCTDALSGVASCPQAQTVANEGAGQVVSGTATDVADNSASASVTVSLDSTPPALAITSPADGTTVSDPQVTLTGTVSDGLSGLASVTCNGGAASLAGGGFSCTVSLGPGPNGLQVVATDVAGNVSSASITVNQATGGDTTPPRISITAPASGSFVLEARPEVRVTLSDDTAIDFASLALTANGNPLAASCQTDGPDAARCTLGQDLADGTVALGATVADLAGNPASAAASFVVDTAGLGVAITSPTDGSVTTGDSVAVSGTASAGVASVVINGVPAPIAAGSFTATVPLREGINMVVALATKASGRTGTASIQVTRDIFAPIVRIDSPRQGFVSVNNTVAVTGLVNDIVPGGAEATVTVNGVAAGVGGGAFLLESLPLVRGPNTLEAVATDRAGNVGRHSIQVFYQPPVGARITLGSGNGQFGVVDNDVPQPLVATVVDDLGNPVAGRLVRFEVTRNNGLLRHGAGDSPVRELQAPTNGAGQASVIWTLGDTAGVGTNRVIASVVGAAGEVEFCATGLPRPAERILMTMGDNQRGVVGAPLTTPLEALVIDHGGNPIEGVTVTFTVEKGGGTLEGGPSVARTTGPDGLARAVLTLGREPGVANNVVSANFAGNTGLLATYTASGLTAGNPADTRFAGVVLDNSLTPIPGATVEASAGGVTTSATTDTAGQFLLTGVPVGAIHLHIDPSASPRPETFPPLAFETVTIAGQLNQLGQPILIPALDTSNSQLVGGAQDVTLTMNGVEGLALTVFANSVTCPDGSHSCRVTISQVHLDKVPMPPPFGAVFMPPAWTVQPHGVVFNPPARISLPNNGLPPGRMIDIFQFDHELNMFVNIGKGTVAEDGSRITSDPGFGITRAGWGGGGPPPPPPTCTCQCDDGNECTEDRCSGQPNCTCFYRPLTNGSCCNGVPIDPATQGCCDGDKIYMKRTQCCADGEVVVKKPIAFGDLLDCTDRIMCPTWVRQYDGCSLPISPGFDKDNPAGGRDTQFAVCNGFSGSCPNSHACDTHDTCYQTCYGGGPLDLIVAKARCDVGMWRDMRATCAASQENFLVRKVCFDFADIYYIGLRLGGDYAFLSRQYNDVCQCCP